jgi:hypothetical protein
VSASGFTPRAEQLILTRDGGNCVRCEKHVVYMQRGIAWSIHHRRPKGRGGTSLAWVNAAANGVVLCGSGTTGCHGEVESQREQAIADGLLVSANGRLKADEVPIKHARLGLVLLNDEGGYEPVAGEPLPDDEWKDVA